MADKAARGPGGRAATTPPAGAPAARPGPTAPVRPEDRGRTTVADTVVAKIAGAATREVPGVRELGGGTARAIAAVRRRVPGGRPGAAYGVSVEVGERQCAVDLDMVVEYGVPITELAVAVREKVVDAIERITALEVVEVNIAVDDVHMGDDAGGERRIR